MRRVMAEIMVRQKIIFKGKDELKPLTLKRSLMPSAFTNQR
ncbi:hypothetical protein PO124_11325 [Bacillus licheniformis]|nr:hypothetical protein [Bacillus licheniformis]